MIRKILSIIAGYSVFVISSLLLFELSGQKPHEDAINLFIIFAAIYGAFFSIVAGYITRLIAKSETLNINYILAVIIAGFALFSLVGSDGRHWTQILAIVIFAPISIVGGMLGKSKMPLHK
ncbi:hypothetical protein [Pedobacter endophyticus]|uniref:TIGR04086 family membrane protein n=1 Tax=Pedobacter endophyticus TaxID=2789740 RepID=A0A7S9Q038_9SPHI|nr:hypothetical protein [Pedobacter endophyticus]QPH40988.1 hypothetical protein IZT61_06940 [Pedobacter endophyticus]